jgi:hypothetical protein
MDAADSPHFRNMNELLDYLARLEQRLTALETENTGLKESLELTRKNSLLLLDQESEKLPNSMLLSNSFLTRAFAVWGHYFVAQLIISIPIIICYLIFFFVVIMGNMQNFR